MDDPHRSMSEESKRITEQQERNFAKNSMRIGMSSELPDEALAVIFEQAWEDDARGCGSFTMRLLVAEIYRLRALVRTSEASKWIPVAASLPSRRCCVLAFTHRRITFENPIGHCEYRVVNFDGERFEADHVTHWMPLPEVPGGEPLVQKRRLSGVSERGCEHPDIARCGDWDKNGYREWCGLCGAVVGAPAASKPGSGDAERKKPVTKD